MPGYQTTIVEAQADGTAVSGTTETTLLAGTACRIILPSGYLNRVGRRLGVRASGRISNIVTTPGTITFRFKLGTSGTPIAVATSSAIQLNVNAKTNVGWWLDLSMLVRAIGTGTSATIMAQGTWQSESVVGSGVPSAGGAGSAMWQAATPVVGTGFDSTIQNFVDLSAQFSLTGNSIQVHTFALEDINYTP